MLFIMCNGFYLWIWHYFLELYLKSFIVDPWDTLQVLFQTVTISSLQKDPHFFIPQCSQNIQSNAFLIRLVLWLETLY